MNLAELVSAVATESEVSKDVAERVLKALGVVTQAQVKTGGEFTLPGIAKISVITKAARTGRNPQTGKEIQIAAKKSPKFTALKALKDAAAA